MLERETKSFARIAFAHYLRTGRRLAWPNAPTAEQKFNPWHDPRNGQFTFGPAGARLGDTGDDRAEAAHGSQTAESKPAAKPREKHTLKGKKPDDVRRHFQSTVTPTIDNAITQIKASKFGKTKAGKYVVDKIERMHKLGKITIADVFDADGKRLRGKRTADGIIVDTLMANHVSKLASELVHEATHDLLSDEYEKTGKRKNGNSIDQEALTNGYQLRLYRQQRKYGFRDGELELRLEASNVGKLRQNIRNRYEKFRIPEHQPKK